MENLAENLLGTTRTAVLTALLLRPEKSLHVREIARLTGASPGSLHRELRLLASLGLLTRTEAGRQVYYAANCSSPVYPDLAGLLRKTAGVVDPLRSALLPLSRRIRAAFVYGSVASGTERPDSDLDLLVLGDVGFGAVVKALAPAQASLGRELNPAVMKLVEFTRKARGGEPYVLNILRGPKLWILGVARELGEPGKDRPAAQARGQPHGGGALAPPRRAGTQGRGGTEHQ